MSIAQATEAISADFQDSIDDCWDLEEIVPIDPFVASRHLSISERLIGAPDMERLLAIKFNNCSLVDFRHFQHETGGHVTEIAYLNTAPVKRWLLHRSLLI